MKKSLFIVLLFVVMAAALPLSLFGQETPGWFLPFDSIFGIGRYYSHAITVGDINNDSFDDVVVTAYDSYFGGIDKIFVFIQNNTHTFNPPISYDINEMNGYDSDQVLFGDVNGDGFNDVVACAADGFAVFTQKGSDPLDPLNPAQFYQTTRSNGITTFTPINIQLGDFNHDDLQDIAVRNSSDNQILVFYQNSSHTFDNASRYPASANMGRMVAADFDGDDLIDIIYLENQFSSSGPINFVVLTQAASGGFNAPYKKSYTFPDPLEYSINSMEVGDVTGDGQPDIVISHGSNKPNSYISVLANLGGILADPVTYTSYDVPYALAIADISGDGRNDIVVQHTGWGHLGLYLQNSSGTLASEELYKYRENNMQWNSLACGDINGDGHMDAIQAGREDGLSVLLGTSGTVPPTINVLCPNGGQKWTMGDSHRIEWSATSDVEYVKIEFSINNGGSWVTLAEKESDPNNIFLGDIPFSQPSAQCRMRITQVLADGTLVPGVSDTSLWPFEIYDGRTPSLIVTSPNGGENWALGENHDITWASTGTVGDINIDYSTDDGGSWISVIAGTENDGSFTWTVPDTPSSACLIRVTSMALPAVTDSSDAVFAISAPFVAVTAPNGGEQWQRGITQTITWTSLGVNNVKIQLIKGTAVNATITSSTSAAAGSYSWAIPAAQAVATNYKIRVVSKESSAVQDSSDANFTIFAPSITVTSPATGAKWQHGVVHTITWTTIGTMADSVKIQLYKGTTKKLDIILSTENDGVYDWLIPATLAKGIYTIRIATVDNKVKGRSGVFSIVLNI